MAPRLLHFSAISLTASLHLKHTPAHLTSLYTLTTIWTAQPQTPLLHCQPCLQCLAPFHSWGLRSTQAPSTLYEFIAFLICCCPTRICSQGRQVLAGSSTSSSTTFRYPNKKEHGMHYCFWISQNLLSDMSSLGSLLIPGDNRI